jgi:hypothetical protein
LNVEDSRKNPVPRNRHPVIAIIGAGRRRDTPILAATVDTELWTAEVRIAVPKRPFVTGSLGA